MPFNKMILRFAVTNRSFLCPTHIQGGSPVYFVSPALTSGIYAIGRGGASKVKLLAQKLTLVTNKTEYQLHVITIQKSIQ